MKDPRATARGLMIMWMVGYLIRITVFFVADRCFFDGEIITITYFIP